MAASCVHISGRCGGRVVPDVDYALPGTLLDSPNRYGIASRRDPIAIAALERDLVRPDPVGEVAGSGYCESSRLPLDAETRDF